MNEHDIVSDKGLPILDFQSSSRSAGRQVHSNTSIGELQRVVQGSHISMPGVI